MRYLTIAGALLFTATAALAQDQNVKFSIESITCGKMLKMENEERDFTLVFLHGFVSGKKATVEFDGPGLTEATETILDSCIDTPNDTLLSVFEKVRG